MYYSGIYIGMLAVGCVVGLILFEYLLLLILFVLYWYCTSQRVWFCYLFFPSCAAVFREQ